LSDLSFIPIIWTMGEMNPYPFRYCMEMKA